MRLLTALNPYIVWIKAGAIALVLAATFATGYRYRDARAEAQVATIREQVANDARLQIEAAQKQAYDAEQAREDMRRKLAAYKPKVVERVRANPSGCNLPKPVADGLRDQVRETNKAIVSSAG